MSSKVFKFVIIHLEHWSDWGGARESSRYKPFGELCEESLEVDIVLRCFNWHTESRRERKVCRWKENACGKNSIIAAYKCDLCKAGWIGSQKLMQPKHRQWMGWLLNERATQAKTHNIKQSKMFVTLIEWRFVSHRAPPKKNKILISTLK